MAGGTSSGGLIAIMLGRLRMTVDECIDAYPALAKESFKIINQILNTRDLDQLLKDNNSSCRVYAPPLPSFF